MRGAGKRVLHYACPQQYPGRPKGPAEQQRGNLLLHYVLLGLFFAVGPAAPRPLGEATVLLNFYKGITAYLAVMLQFAEFLHFDKKL